MPHGDAPGAFLGGKPVRPSGNFTQGPGHAAGDCDQLGHGVALESFGWKPSAFQPHVEICARVLRRQQSEAEDLGSRHMAGQAIAQFRRAYEHALQPGCCGQRRKGGIAQPMTIVDESRRARLRFDH